MKTIPKTFGHLFEWTKTNEKSLDFNKYVKTELLKYFCKI